MQQNNIEQLIDKLKEEENGVNVLLLCIIHVWAQIMVVLLIGCVYSNSMENLWKTFEASLSSRCLQVTEY